MEVVLLGTGSADGWPNPFCGCASCDVQRRRGVVRAPTSALVDGVLLLDCGPEAPRAAVRAGRDLGAVTHVLLTHDHPDHSAPMALLARSWAGRRTPLEVLGPPGCLQTWRPWAAPDDPVTFRPLAAGNVVDAGGHRVRALPARHHGASGEPGLLFDVTGPDGARLLWATDTGPLPAGALPAGARYDVVLLEETFGERTDHGTDHLDLASFAEEVRRLRAARAVDGGTRVVAVHLGHRNPPDVDAVLAACGARAGVDLEVLHAGPGARSRPDAETVAGRVGATGRVGSAERLLVLGGARSGKSTYAERVLAGAAEVTYVATGPAPSDDDAEWARRVAVHRERRPPGWCTRETTDVAGVLREARGAVLVDCLTLWLAARLDDRGAWQERAGWEDAVEADVAALVEAWRGTRARVVAVSNEVGSGVVPPTASGRVFRDWQGRLNARLAADADRVVLVVAGRPLELGRGA